MKRNKRKAKRSVTTRQVHRFVREMLEEDFHAMHVISLGNAVNGAVHAAALSIHAIGPALAAASDLNRQGLFWYQAMPNMRDERFNTLMKAYLEIIQEHAVMRTVFGVL